MPMRYFALTLLALSLLALPGCRKLPQGEVERIPQGDQEYYRDYYQTPPIK